MRKPRIVRMDVMTAVFDSIGRASIHKTSSADEKGFGSPINQSDQYRSAESNNMPLSDPNRKRKARKIGRT